jgi:hypothetical protein
VVVVSNGDVIGLPWNGLRHVQWPSA